MCVAPMVKMSACGISNNACVDRCSEIVTFFVAYWGVVISAHGVSAHSLLGDIVVPGLREGRKNCMVMARTMRR